MPTTDLQLVVNEDYLESPHGHSSYDWSALLSDDGSLQNELVERVRSAVAHTARHHAVENGWDMRGDFLWDLDDLEQHAWMLVAEEQRNLLVARI